jgi:hypothetical protein
LALRGIYDYAKFGASDADLAIEQKGKIDAYEREMRDRTVWAVEMSRQAVYDAHDLKNLTKDSAVLARRAVTATAL